MNDKLPVWRSMLFVPVTVQRFVDGAAGRGADAIILDLEDSIAASEKERARGLVPQAAETVSRGGADVVVRINRPWRQALRDIEAAVGPGVQALALPKTGSAEHVRMIAEVVDELEVERGMAPGTTRFIAMIETAAALFRIADIARPSAPRRLGFVGASVIHPSQVAILNEEFRPSRDEIDHACRVLAAYEKALAGGVGAVTVDGKMIDVPVVERARLLVEREQVIAARVARMQNLG